MNKKPADNVLKKPICTWLSESDYAIIVAAAQANGVKPATYFRGVLIDAIHDERERFRKSLSAKTKS